MHAHKGSSDRFICLFRLPGVSDNSQNAATKCLDGLSESPEGKAHTWCICFRSLLLLPHFLFSLFLFIFYEKNPFRRLLSDACCRTLAFKCLLSDTCFRTLAMPGTVAVAGWPPSVCDCVGVEGSPQMSLCTLRILVCSAVFSASKALRSGAMTVSMSNTFSDAL